MNTKTFEYNFIYMPSHPKASSNGCVYEHVLVAEKILGRFLSGNEVVHHIDKNKKNNAPNNLMIFASNAEHNFYHSGSPAWSNDGIIWHSSSKKSINTCIICHKKFITESPKQKYCSINCCHKPYHKSPIASMGKDELFNLIKKTNGNFLALGKIYGISDNAIRRRCKKIGIPYHSSYYRNMGD